MAKLQWLKTKVGLFSDPRILYLRNQPQGDSYFVLWMFLKDLAGIINDDGNIYVSPKEPMTVELLAKLLHRRKSFIEKGLAILQHLDLLEMKGKGMLRIAIWDELQDFQREEHRRELGAKRQQRYRERQRQAEKTDTPVAALTTPQSAGADSSPNPGRLEVGTAQRDARPDTDMSRDTYDVGARQRDVCPDTDVSRDTYDVGARQRHARPDEDMNTNDVGTAQRDARPDTDMSRDTYDVRARQRHARPCQHSLRHVSEDLADYPSVECYDTLFHGLNDTIIAKLKELEAYWGTAATCKAIEIAKEAGVNNVHYIQNVLVNSNGKPIKRGEQQRKSWEPLYPGCNNAAAYTEEMLEACLAG